MNQIASALPATLQREVYLELYEHRYERAQLLCLTATTASSKDWCSYSTSSVAERRLPASPNATAKNCVCIQASAIHLSMPARLPIVLDALMKERILKCINANSSEAHRDRLRVDEHIATAAISDFEKVINAYPAHRRSSIKRSSAQGDATSNRGVIDRAMLHGRDPQKQGSLTKLTKSEGDRCTNG